MAQDTTKPLSIFLGQRNAIRMISQSHGIIRPNMVDSLEGAVKISVKRIPEFDNKVDALIYSTFDGASGKIGYSESNQGLISACLMDLDPTVPQQMVNAAGPNFGNFHFMFNAMGLDGNIKGAGLLYSCTASELPWTQPVKEAAKRTLSWEALNFLWFPGLAALYTRGIGTGVQQAAPTKPVVATSTTGGVLTADTYYVQIAAVTAAGETTPSPEAGITVPTGTVTNKITVTVPAIAGAITSYNVYVTNRSNGERLIGNTVTTSFDITLLPGTTAARPQTSNTSGTYQATGDKVFSSSGANWILTLDKTAQTLQPQGIQYALVIRDGVVVATVDNPATQDTFLINTAGTGITINEDPANHVWEFITLYQP